MMKTIRDCLAFNWKVLTFRAGAEDFAAAKWPQYVYGFFITWLVGFGRWWDADDVKIEPIMRTGIGSIAYSFFMSFLIYFCMKWMLKLKAFNDLKIIPQTWLFVTHTSLPGLLYAIPVEMFMTNDMATRTNSIFLAAVALWRVSLFMHHLSWVRNLTPGQTLCAMFLPLAGILTALTAFGLESSTFDFMSGNSGAKATSAMQAQWEVVAGLAVFSVMGLFIMVPAYLLVAERAWFVRRDERKFSAAEGKGEP